ncbi:MAG TPA: PLP-dependent aminotransferase family protein [Thermoanaerobaculia bacterium]|nr:PLP-dependent aminotransferase family protein [Thermoanaerobaculia bacterium]
MTTLTNPPLSPTSTPQGVIRLAKGAAQSGPVILREIFLLALRPGVISFAIGLPANELFPAEDLSRTAAGLLARKPESLQYGVPSRVLKQKVAGMMAQRGVTCAPEQIFLTSGAQQAFDLLAHLLLDPGGQVMIEETVYECVLSSLRKFVPELITLPGDATGGLDLDVVEARLAAGARPAFLYTIPTAHNPLGVSLSAEKRRRLADIARRYELPVLEDDAYGFLGNDDSPDDEAPPAVRSFDDRWVIYLGSFSKILAPALRVGWIVVPEDLIPRLQALKQGNDIDTATLSQELTAAYLEAGLLPAHLTRIRAAYRERRQTLLRALTEHFPAGVRWNLPTGGMFLWLELPSELDATELLRTAVEIEKVAFCPGVAFAAGNSRHADHCLRLSFASLSPDRIEEGIRRLARAVRRALDAR